MLLQNSYVGGQETSRIYLGSDLVWQKEGPPPAFNWEARFNLSFDGAVDDAVSEANIIRPVLASLIMPNPTPFGAVLNTNGEEVSGISVQMTGANTRGDIGEVSPPLLPDANLYRQKWWNNGSWFVDFSGLDDTKRYTVQFVSYESASTVGQVITTTTYRKGAAAANVFVISGDASNPSPVSYDFSEESQIRQDELLTVGGAMRFVIQRNGSLARSTISYIVVREYDVIIEGTQTLQTSGSTSSPLPFIEYIPSDTSTPKPAFIWLHGSGERGNGTTQLVNAMKYGPNYSVSMGTFRQDAYAFTPQIPVATDSFWPDKLPEIDSFVDYVLANYNVDPSKLYLIGYSDGAFGVGGYLQYTKANRKTAAVVNIAGDPLFLQYPTYLPGGTIPPEDVADVPIRIFSNRFDTVSPLNFSVDAVADIKLAANYNHIEYTIFNDYAHEYPQKVVNGSGMGPMVDASSDPFTQGIFEWLLQYTL